MFGARFEGAFPAFVSLSLLFLCRIASPNLLARFRKGWWRGRVVCCTNQELVYFLFPFPFVSCMKNSCFKRCRGIVIDSSSGKWARASSD